MTFKTMWQWVVLLSVFGMTAMANEPNSGLENKTSDSAENGNTETVTNEEGKEGEFTTDESIEVVKRVSYANTTSSKAMGLQQTNLTSALAVVDNLPGVLVNEGDTFGADDWSTTVTIRGFQLSLDQQQIGITIDGIANGNSNYGGGAKANRYIDTENLFTVDVSQGTADIASRSNEALGGTLNFTTINPGLDRSMTASLTLGEFDAQKAFMRYETGEFGTNTYAWISASVQQSSDWVDGSAQNTRDHFATKFISTAGKFELTGYLSYDDTHEDNYQRVSYGQFLENPEWDRLNPDWTGIPHVDQVYRRGWSTLRENLFGYLKADWESGSVDWSANIYHHQNEGRGDWIPPYIRDVVDDNGGPETELGDTTIRSADTVGRIYFVDRNGVALQPDPDCAPSITFPYGGSGPAGDPDCYPAGAIPVGSYRHTHYKKERSGFNLDFEWETSVGDGTNTLRGGIWYEDYHREESRDWHRIIDSRSSFRFDHVPYVVQYDRDFPVTTLMTYLEDTLSIGSVTARVGIKNFDVQVEGQNNFSGKQVDIDSNSDVLFSGGILVNVTDETELFAGYAENFAAVKDTVLERFLLDSAPSLQGIEPEIAENIDAGIRYRTGRVNASVTLYMIDFDNRLTFRDPNDPETGIDFGEELNGFYENVGGVESKGLEASINYLISDEWGLMGSYTNNDSEYLGGDSSFPEGNTVYGSVEDQWVLSFDWTRDAYLAGLSTKYVGDRWLDAANTQPMDAYTVLDFYAGVQVKINNVLDPVNLRFTINNLTDESYLGGVAGQSAWIGAPRTAAFNISTRF